MPENCITVKALHNETFLVNSDTVAVKQQFLQSPPSVGVVTWDRKLQCRCFPSLFSECGSTLGWGTQPL